MSQDSATQLAQPVDERDHIRGLMTAPVTLVEYGDFQSEECAVAYRIVKELLREMPGYLRFVFRHFPLARIHPYAEHAADASESAAAQGKFWEMHDYLFEHQGELEDTALDDYAEEFGFYVDEFEMDLVEHTYHDRIHEDIKSGLRSGVTEPPTFFINGVRHEGPIELESMRMAVKVAASIESSRRRKH